MWRLYGAEFWCVPLSWFAVQCLFWFRSSRVIPKLPRSFVFHSSKFFRRSRICLRSRFQALHNPWHILFPPHPFPIPQSPRLLHLLPAYATAPPPLHRRLLPIAPIIAAISLPSPQASSVATHARRISNPINQSRLRDRLRDSHRQVRSDR